MDKKQQYAALENFCKKDKNNLPSFLFLIDYTGSMLSAGKVKYLSKALKAPMGKLTKLKAEFDTALFGSGDPIWIKDIEFLKKMPRTYIGSSISPTIDQVALLIDAGAIRNDVHLYVLTDDDLFPDSFKEIRALMYKHPQLTVDVGIIRGKSETELSSVTAKAFERLRVQFPARCKLTTIVKSEKNDLKAISRTVNKHIYAI